MKKMKTTWQRVMAMALVLVMTLSYLPLGVVAEGEAVAETKNITLVQATLTATPNYAEKETEPEASTPEGDATEPETTAADEEKAEIVSYTYNVAVESLGEDVTEKAKIITEIKGNHIESIENLVVPVDQTFAVDVFYKGVKIHLDSKEAAVNGSTSAFITATYDTAYNLTQWQSYDLNDYIPVLKSHNAPETGKWVLENDTNYKECVVNGIVEKQGGAQNFGTLVYAIDGNEPLVKIDLIHNVSAPTYTVSLAGAEDGGWYCEDVDVAVTAVANVQLAKMPENLPAISAEDAKIGEWSSADENNSFTATVTVDKTTKIVVADQSLEVKIDKVEPEISNVESYNNSEGKTVVEFDVKVGDSGIAKTAINGKEYSYTESGKRLTVTTDEALNEGFTISVTSVAGMTGTVDENAQPVPMISVEITVPEQIIGEANGITYISEDAEFVITVSDSYGEFAPDITGEVEVNWDGTKGTFSLKPGDKLEGMTVKVTDNKRRIAEASFATVYEVDNTAPVISIVGLQKDELTYVQDVQEYIVTITDDGILGDIEKNCSAEYFLAGDEEGKKITFDENGKGTVVLTHGQNLVKIVANATDASGNSAEEKIFTTNVLVDEKNPKITAEVSAKDEKGDAVTVSSFYNKGDKFFAILDPVETNEINGTVTMTVVYTLVEDYPNAAALLADGWEEENGTWTKVIEWTVTENSTKATSVNVTAKDMSGRVPTDSVIIKGANEAGGELVLTLKDGVYSGKISIDRRTPGTGVSTAVPEVVLKPSVETDMVTADGVLLYNEDFTYEISVNDDSEDENDSGVKTVTWSVTGADFLDGTETTEEGSGTYTIDVTSTTEGEDNDISVLVTIVDEVGNTFYKTETFAFDNLAPRVTVSYDNNTAKNENFFNASREATITYEDLNLSVAQYMKDAENEVDLVIADGEAKVAVVFDADGHHTLSTYVADLAKHTSIYFDPVDGTVAPYDFYVDTTRPVVTVEQDNNDVKGNVENTEYYDNGVKFTITASDAYMGTAYDGAEAWVQYTKTLNDGDVLEETIDLMVAEDRKAEITVGEGETLTDLQVYACDNAGWTTDLQTERKSDFTEIKNDSGESTGIYQFNKDIAVDMNPAVVTVEKTVGTEENPGNFVQTINHGDETEPNYVDYYNNVVTYNLTITDHFQMQKDVAQVEIMVDYNNDEKDITLLLGDENLKCEETEEPVGYVYTTSFTVEDSEDITGITILVKDNAGNITEEIAVVDEDDLTSFEYDESAKNAYTGNRVVVDMTAPKASWEFSENVKSVYTNGGTVYAVLDKPATGNSGELAPQGVERVTATITVEDLNIDLHDVSVKTISSAEKNETGAWEGKGVVNTANTLTYTEYIEVKADKTGAFNFDLSVLDFAANPLEEMTFNYLENGNTVMIPVDEDGTVGTTVSVDRRRPHTNEDDNQAPVIDLTIPAHTTTSDGSDGVDLFSGPFSFGLKVTDGTEGALNSGINTVSWEIKDPVGFVAAYTSDNPQEKGTYEQSFDIAVGVNGVGESNDAVLTITAVDNVGNTTTYEKKFGVDNEAPRIKVEYDNNSAQNEKYFKENRTAIVTVDDINFDPQTTTITTQVSPSGWSQNGSKWTSSCLYNTDGEYTFAVSSTDRANNTTNDDGVDYSGQVAPRDFTLDKTAPVITVTYNPSAPIGQDDQGVSYYDTDLDVTVNINEVNFRAGDVNAQFNSDNQLSAFSGGSGSYTAYETFTEGNEYKFSVAYTDLAGNPATTYESHIFSVDLTNPTIEITRGNLKEANLNIVQGDLVLEFTINDEQSNLDTYDVKVTRLNNEFKEETVTGSDFYIVSSADQRTRVVVDFESIIKEKGNDGIYTVKIDAKDYAGRRDDMVVQFSLNRFGSTFITDDPFTQDFLTPSADGSVYKNVVGKKLIFKEINPNKVWSENTDKGSTLTVVVNGTTTILEEGTDYNVTEDMKGAGNSKWYVYTYEVDPSIFMQDESLVDGRYSLLIYGEDEAGNKNTNESNEFGGIQLDETGEYSGKIEFTLDATAPIISTTGIETGGSYDATNQKMNIFISDNTPSGIVVYLNGQLVQALEAAGAAQDAWVVWDQAEGCYVLNVPEQNILFGRQAVEINATDAAGNESQSVVDDFTVSSNAFVRFVNSVWFWIVLALLAAGATFLIIFLQKKKKGAKAAA